MSQILIIEDNEEIACGLRRNLEIEGHGVSLAVDGSEGLVQAQAAQPDLVVIDLTLPGMDGLEVIRSLRDSGFAGPILVLTARREEADKVRGLRFGADDYVTKPFGLLEFLARVEALLRRSKHSDLEPSADGEVERFGDIEVDLGSRTVRRGGKPVPLAPMEFELLLALVRRRGAVASRLELMKEVWGHQAAVLSRTVDTHIAGLRRKLEDDPANPRHILTVQKTGYRLVG